MGRLSSLAQFFGKPEITWSSKNLQSLRLVSLATLSFSDSKPDCTMSGKVEYCENLTWSMPLWTGSHKLQPGTFRAFVMNEAKFPFVKKHYIRSKCPLKHFYRKFFLWKNKKSSVYGSFYWSCFAAIGVLPQPTYSRGRFAARLKFVNMFPGNIVWCYSGLQI